MSNAPLRRQIAWEAARLLAYREESEIYRARWKAALRVCGGKVRASDLPANREIQEQAQRLGASLDRDDDPYGVLAGRVTADAPLDRFRTYETLLAPLEQVREDRAAHPEGDALYHSLQVFELARGQIDYDEEFLLAALLHDVGKAIDRQDHVSAGLAALDGSITPRTAWFIEHHVEALSLQESKLGLRAHRRLAASDDFQELMLLADCDRRGRVKGARVPEVHEALAFLRQLAQEDESV